MEENIFGKKKVVNKIVKITLVNFFFVLVWSGLVCDLEQDEEVITLLLPASRITDQTNDQLFW